VNADTIRADSIRLDKRLLILVSDHRLALAATIGLGLAAGMLSVLVARYLSQIIGQVFLGGAGLGEVQVLLARLLAILLLRALLAAGSERAANAIALQVKTRLRGRLYEHLLALGPAYAREERTGELANTAIEGVEVLDAYYSQYLPQLVLAALVPLTFLLFVFPLDWVSALVLLVTAPLIPLFMILIGKAAQSLTRRQWRALSRMSAYFLDVLQGLTTLKILGGSRAQIGVIDQVSERFRQTTLSVLRVTFLSALVLEMVATLSTAVVAVEIGLRLLYNQLTFEQAFFVLLLAPEFYLPLRLLGSRFHAGMAGVSAARRIFAILETQPPSSTAVLLSATQPPSPARNPITFEAVHYAYRDERPALNGVTFTLRPGEKTALVGPSGAGKSTLADLLLRFLTPQAGVIFVGDRPLDEIPAQTWRAQVGWVPQRPHLFNDSVAANLRLARPGASQAEVEQAARRAHAHDFIQALPQGYDTPIGERGARLSAGQRQRLALARAFLKDAPLLVLDEATTNLDPESESLIQEALERLLAGRTALIIAHRLSTVAAADQILVLEHGRVVEAGTHASLQVQAGLYPRLLAASQAAEPLPKPGAPALFDFNGPTIKAAREQPLAGAAQAPSPASLAAQEWDPRSPAGFATLRRLLGFLQPYAGWVALAVLAGFATVVSSIGLMAAAAYIISAAALHASIADLQVAIVGVRFFGITRGLFRYLERYVSHQVTFRLLARLRVWFYAALEPLAPARLMRYHSGDLLARILDDIQTLESFYVRVVAPPLVAALVGLVTCLFLARFSARLALALLFFLTISGIGIPLLTHRLGRRPGRQAVLQRAALNAALVDGIQGMADLLANGRGQSQQARLNKLSMALAGTQRRMADLSGLQNALSSFAAGLGMWAALVLAIPLVHSGQIEGVNLAVIVLAALTSFEAAQPLPLAAQFLESNLQAARRLFELVDARPEVIDPPAPLALPAATHSAGLTLAVRHLSFRYPPALEGQDGPEREALHDLSFDLPAGAHLAIVGPSGAGKTTLVNLLLRLWDYQEGEILLAGQDLRCFRASDVRSLMSVVSQDTDLFNASLRDNLLLARPGASQERIEAAIREAQLQELVQALPQGLDTWIGEQGLRLSGGERQRLAVARALLRDTPLLILDEAAANLDALTEQQVLQAIYRLIKGRTVLAITHRLVGLEGMDEILVLNQGECVERGSHAELLAAGGLYRRMWDLQTRVLPVRAGLTLD
jgi:ATP-binding cassette subfamily C protein CydCD